MTTTVERRFVMIEAALDELAPRPSEYDRFKAENPCIDWMSCSELTELAEIYERDENGAGLPADGERALAIVHTSKARMLAGEPKDIDLPPVPFEVRLQRAYEANNEHARRKQEEEAKD